MPDPPGLDLRRLTAHLDEALPGLRAGALRAALLPGGRSNLTYALTDGRTRWVLRRPPLGHVLATAHDMGREHRVMGALAPTAVPVPPMVHHCPDPAVLGAPFYLMGHVAGLVYRESADLAGLSPGQVRALALELMDVLAALHTVDPAAVGLADLGRPAGYNARQVWRWKQQLDASRSRDLPGVDELHSRLAAAVPSGPAAVVVHGDFRLDNVLVGEDGTVRAVLDWEMSTLGDPLADLGLSLVYAGRVDVPGQPDADTLATRYADRTGLSLDDLDWYLAFAAFKLAVILEGVHYRFVLGRTVGEGFDTVGVRVPPLVAQGLATIRRT
ncbi:Predicted kinase, aminoglycoside phosphotransferase (APT) family [Micromonospora nigra]|uniref:Predicted kinase, aminoglycoside phosphotransferase (APT) family n=1 Tax=Micromonospora nigra TaxID=145857 RepID=A0A1C6R9L8_9ACTN|nr:phosphotransferase family protein [Micromonospora nigra]SCL13784.1 Predicted kinase, aminoglycoside phosphotransferase (APT) family [Micromonospora nigra]